MYQTTHLSLGKQMSPLKKTVGELRGGLLAPGLWVSWSGQGLGVLALSCCSHRGLHGALEGTLGY